MRSNQGTTVVEFTIYMFITLLVLFSFFSIAIDKVKVVKYQGELIEQSLQKEEDSMYIFSNRRDIYKKINLSNIYTLGKRSRKIEIYNGVGKIRTVLSNLELLKDIIVNTDLYQDLINEFNFDLS